MIKTLETGGIDLLEFFVPAHYNNNIPNSSSLELEDGYQIRLADIQGERTIFSHSHHIVILNLSRTRTQEILSTGISA